jgi:hypothetical protein
VDHVDDQFFIVSGRDGNNAKFVEHFTPEQIGLKG